MKHHLERGKQLMNKQEPSKFSAPGNDKGSMIANRYYVQHLTEQIFLVRERLSANGTPGADDHIVRSFSTLHDAHVYANSLNDA
jgi:hypothetical protein